jgi:hypothetical protein
MIIVIENRRYPYDLGCRLLKLKYEDCPMAELEDVWHHIEPLTFQEIASKFDNIEDRRIAFKCLGIERLVKEVEPRLIDTQTIEKRTTWVNTKGEMQEKAFSDTYELYEVSARKLNMMREWQMERGDETFFNYVKCKDTSTDREYLIWVNAASVWMVNANVNWITSAEDYGKKINAIQAVAWTIQTNVQEGGIEKIVRQGDCILVKKKPDAKINADGRHLTESEYRELITAES